MSTLRIVLALAVLALPIRAVAAPDSASVLPVSPEGGARLRAYDARAAALVLAGLRRSPTLRAMVDRIEAGDVIVYLGMQPLLRRDRLAGLLTWMTASPKFRYVRVSINPELPQRTAIAALGHELQHVLEVINEPSIVDSASLESFYLRHGISMRISVNSWDSEAARDTGDKVRHDLVGDRSARIETIKGYDPLEWEAMYQRARGTANSGEQR
jgi:hypothetical protein